MRALNNAFPFTEDLIAGDKLRTPLGGQGEKHLASLGTLSHTGFHPSGCAARIDNCLVFFSGFIQ
jgi:hypothetical protein